MDTIQEVEMKGGENAEDESRRSKESEGKSKGSVVAQLKVLDHIRVNVEPESPVSTLKNIFKSSPDLSFSKVGLKKAEEKMKQALIEFHGKLRLLKSYRFNITTLFSSPMCIILFLNRRNGVMCIN